MILTGNARDDESSCLFLLRIHAFVSAGFAWSPGFYFNIVASVIDCKDAHAIYMGFSISIAANADPGGEHGGDIAATGGASGIEHPGARRECGGCRHCDRGLHDRTGADEQRARLRFFRCSLGWKDAAWAECFGPGAKSIGSLAF